MDSLSLLQNVHRNEGRRPILWRNLFVAKYLCNNLNWNTGIPVYLVAQGLITEWLTHLKMSFATYIDLEGGGQAGVM